MISGWIEFGRAILGPAAAVGQGTLSAPGIEVRAAGDSASLAHDTSCIVAAQGSPRFGQSSLEQHAQKEGPASAWLARYRDRGSLEPSDTRGTFAVALLDLAAKRAILATDRFSIQPLCFAVEGSRFAFADRADEVPLAGVQEIDPQGIFDYLYFHVIPAPRTIFRSVSRVPAGHQVVASNRRVEATPWWQARFEERERGPLDALKAEFRQVVKEAVAREVGRRRVGAFLSGGTDSSTVSGMMGEVTGEPARTYSIGFDAEGYDEMAYARIAARHFRTAHHEHYLTPDEVVAGIPIIAAQYDQPFGNSSALPAYYCAKLAREDGVERLLAGDGGDELFGGNARYARQRLLGMYAAIPALLRHGLVEPALLGAPALAKIPLIRKAASYVEQARVAMPDRLEMYNLLSRLGPETVLTRDFLETVDVDGPGRQQRETWRRSDAATLINRMLAYDWKYTLADNDLPKVLGTGALAGVEVGFPFLADEVADFSLRLAPELKLNGLKLRWFFKEALRGFLPDEILAKRKHGFGLPFGVWLVRHQGLHALASDTLGRLRARGIVRVEFLDQLMDRRLADHPGYYGEMVWILVMLEQWLTTNAGRSRVG